MAEFKEYKKSSGIANLPTVIIAKRALSFGKTYIIIAIFITLVALDASRAVKSVIEVAFVILPVLMLITPMVMLFVYDKNNGVLEYLLSLGMTQRDIYLRYLKAALLIATLYLVAFVIINFTFTYIVLGTTAIPRSLTILAISIILAIAEVAFIITLMMLFSVLQKSRTGGNQPLGIAIGSATGFLPGIIFGAVFSFNDGVIAEIILAAVIGITALVLFMLSGKLIKREKFLP